MTKQKYEREIAEILERLEQQGQGQGQAARPPRPPRASRGGWSGWRLPQDSLRRSNLLWLALSLGLPLLATLLHRFSPPLASLLVLAGIAVFLSPLVLRLFGVMGAEQPSMWRGRVIEMPTRGDDVASRWRYHLWAWRQRWERWRRR